jgi:hypothetical protein
LPKENIWSNLMTIFNMFDTRNQSKLLSQLSQVAYIAIQNRLDKEEKQFLFSYNM